MSKDKTRNASPIKGIDRTVDLDGHLPGIELHHRIGRGAHSDVFVGEARDREVAVKVQSASPAGEAKRRAHQFRREAALLASLSHPAIPEVYEVGTLRNRAYTVMEYIEGRTLTSLLGRETMTEESIVDWALQLLEVLDRIHRRGLVHRDLKPSNILLDDDGRLRLIDVGLACRRSSLNDDERGDEMIGTLQYASPEQLGALDAITDARSDLYAVGLLLYEALAGHPPYDPTSCSDLPRQHATVQPTPLAETGDIDPDLAQFVDRLLRKYPDERIPSAREAVRYLQTADREETPDARSPRRPSGPQRLVGRGDPWRTLERTWREARSGDGRAVVLAGEAGVGKSFLVDQFVRESPDPRVPTAWQKADEGRAAPLSLLRDCLADWLTDLEHVPDDPSVIRDRIEAHLADCPPSVRQLAPDDLRPDSKADDKAGDLDREEFFESVADLVLHIADLLGEAILVVDDLQWADDASRNVLERMLDRIETAPLLVVATCRVHASDTPVDPVFEPTSEPEREAHLLEELDRDQTHRLVTDYLGGCEVDDDLVDAISVRSDGNPFLVVDYLYTMIDAEILRPHWDGWDYELDALDDLDLSDDTFGLVEARLAALDETTAEVLTAAAVIGHRVDPPLLVTVCELDESAIRTAIEAAARAGILARKGLHYEFVHDRLRETLVSGLAESERTAFHLATAAGFEENLDARGADLYAVAAHYLAGGTDARPKTSHRVLKRAGHAAVEAFAPERAIDFLGRAVELTDDHSDLAFDAEDWSALGEAYAHTGQYDEACEALSTAIERADDSFRRTQLRGRICQVYMWNTMNTEPARTQYEQARRELGEVPASEAPIRFIVESLGLFIAGLFIQIVGLGYGSLSGRDRRRARLQMTLYSQGQQVEYWELHPLRSLLYILRGLYAASRLGPSKELVKNYGSAAAILGAIGWESGARWAAQAACRAARRLDRPALVAIARSRAHWSRFEAGYQLETGRAMTSFLESSGQWIDSGHFHYSCAELTWNFHLRGYTDRARHWYDRSVQRHDRSTSRLSGHPVRTGIPTLAHRGDFEEAEQALDQLRRLTDDESDATFRTALYIHGLSALAYFRRDGSRLTKASDLWEPLPLSPSTVPTYTSSYYVFAGYGTADRLYASDDGREASVEQLDQLVDALEVPAGKHENLAGHLRVLRGSLAARSGRDERALEQWRVAEAFARDHDNLWAIFEIRHRRARLFQKRDDREMALDQAGAALQLARRQGWKPLIAKLVDEYPKLVDDSAEI